MHPKLYLFALIAITNVHIKNALVIPNEIKEFELSCHYLDSVNITEGTLRADKSIVFNGVIFEKDNYAVIDYILQNGTTRKTVSPYIRGCVCTLKSCVRLCCPLGFYYENRQCHPHKYAKSFEREVLDENLNSQKMTLDDHFVYVSDRSCSRYYTADEFQIIHTGSILSENEEFSHWFYCLNPVPTNESTKLSLEALVCWEPMEEKVILVEEPTLAVEVGMMLSVPFIVATIWVYVSLPELHNLYGKSLIYHLTCLATGYTIIGVVQIIGWIQGNSMFSEFVGYIAYFSFISSFFWVSVISVELWLNVRTPDAITGSSESKQFASYMLYVWRFSLLFTFIIYILDSFLRDIQPGFGLKTCILDFKNDTQCSYYYLPIWIIFVINQTFFTLIAIKIRRSYGSNGGSQRHAECLMNSAELRQSKMNDEDNFGLYLRLHLVTCLAWIFKGLALFAADKLVIFSNVSYALQGLVIFVLFVLNRHVWPLIKIRWHNLFGNKSTPKTGKTGFAPASYSKWKPEDQLLIKGYQPLWKSNDAFLFSTHL